MEKHIKNHVMMFEWVIGKHASHGSFFRSLAITADLARISRVLEILLFASIGRIFL